MQIISYIDPREIAFILYFFYMMISVVSLATLLVYLPTYLKKEEEARKIKTRFNYLEEIYQQIEFAKKSKYYKANISNMILKGFAYKSGYVNINYNKLSQLIKDNKIDIPLSIKDFLIESSEFYSDYYQIKPWYSKILSFLSFFSKEKELKNSEILLEKAIELLYEKFNI